MRLSKDYDKVAETILKFGEDQAWSAEEYVRDKVKSPTILAALYTSNLLGDKSYHIRCGVVSNRNTPLNIVENAVVYDESPAVREEARKQLVSRFMEDNNIRIRA